MKLVNVAEDTRDRQKSREKIRALEKSKRDDDLAAARSVDDYCLFLVSPRSCSIPRFSRPLFSSFTLYNVAVAPLQ